ncbi:MAG: hypothetical protein II453_13680 [Alphaproteobacteria bacterium]|nr:hypothetical protein [Alphaproteobacteria bacterium]
MGLDKAIEHHKEKREQYRGAKACDKSCRNHGSDDWAKNNRLNRTNRLIEKSNQELKEMKKVENKTCTVTLDVEQAGNLLSVIVTSRERHRNLLNIVELLEKFVKDNDTDKYDNVCLKEFVESQNRRIW